MTFTTVEIVLMAALIAMFVAMLALFQLLRGLGRQMEVMRQLNESNDKRLALYEDTLNGLGVRLRSCEADLVKTLRHEEGSGAASAVNWNIVSAQLDAGRSLEEIAELMAVPIDQLKLARQLNT